MDNSIAQAAELEQIANDAVAEAVTVHTREAHIRAKLALYAAGRAYSKLGNPAQANGFYKRALDHKEAAAALDGHEWALPETTQPCASCGKSVVVADDWPSNKPVWCLDCYNEALGGECG